SARESYDGLITRGGGYMPDETDRAPWLAEEAELVRHSLHTELPQLGVCLVGQLIAKVIGGGVQARTGAPEKWATDSRTDAEAADDPVFAAIRERTSFLESHVDRIVELPAEATLLASSDACEFQAFRMGRAWGTQFHPESTRANILRWDAKKLRDLGFDKDTLVEEAEAMGPESERDAKALFTAFLDVVRGR